MVVDLPAPFGPMNPSSSPRSRLNETPRSASTLSVAPMEDAADRAEEARVTF